MGYTFNLPEFRAEIARKGLNKGQAAEKIGVSRSTLDNVLKGQLPSSRFISKACAALELSPEKAMLIFFTPDLRNA